MNRGILLLLDGSRGTYIPQVFARDFDWPMEADNKAILLEGPDHDFYWEAWETASTTPRITDGKKWWLMHDGDLWAYCPELMCADEKRNFGIEGE